MGDADFREVCEGSKVVGDTKENRRDQRRTKGFMTNKKKPYHSLIVWREAHQFVLEIYRLTGKFPKHELYGLVSQLRRAAASVATNIVEGYARRTDKDMLRFFDMARASLAECEYLLELSRDLRYLTNEEYNHIEAIRCRVSYLLNKFITAKRLN